MNNISIIPTKLKGNVLVPPSKSISHRAIICAAMSKGDCYLSNISLSDDIIATIEGIRALGGKCEIIGDKLFLSHYILKESACINCKESGSTVRFLIPLAAALGIDTRFEGEGRLPERTLEIYDKVLTELGVNVLSNKGFLPFEISGKMRGGKIQLQGNISSQFISGLLMALPLTDEGGEIELTTKLESKPYVDMTIDIMKCFGVIVKTTAKGYKVEGKAQYKSNDYCIDGDYSQGAFWYAANFLGSDIDIQGLNDYSIQGDKTIISILEEMDSLEEITIDASNIPDLIPILAVCAGARKGIKTTFYNAERLRLKESDRIESTIRMLDTLGVEYKLMNDGFIIYGREIFKGGEINSFNDHRIVMASAIASIKCKEPLKIKNYKCVSKSYLKFFDDFISLQGKVK